MRFSIRRQHNSLRVICVIVLAVLIGAPFFLRAAQAGAEAVSWMESEPVLKSTRPLDPAKDPYHEVRSDCKIETVTVVKSFYSPRDPKMQLAVCLARLGEYRIGQRNDGAREVYVSRGDEPFYKVSGIGGVYMKEQLPGIVFTLSHSRSFGYDESVHIRKYTDFTSRLTFNNDKTAYLLNEENPDFALAWGGNRAYASGWGISNNGRYLVYGSGSNYTGSHDLFARVDLQTGERKMFGKGYYEHTHNVEPQPGFVVSNDGTQVVASGTAIFKTWRITPKCLVDRDKMDQFKDPCEFKFIYPKFYGDQWKNLEASHERMMINDEFTELTYQHRALRGQAMNEVVTISIAKHESETPRLDYLALGDSYSSGEGDISGEEANHYLLSTGEEGGCHLSSRAYPYVLAGWWNIDSHRMRSVACSGARIAYDYIARSRYYIGQTRRARHELTSGDKNKITSNALEGFYPGYIPQIEFVKKYKPKIITFTGGGNDVGFADVLQSCAGSVLQKGAIWEFDIISAETCSYARGAVNKLLIDSIYNQYWSVKMLINKIKEASPDTKVYVVGYPQFIEGGAAVCTKSISVAGVTNAGLLNSQERAMIVDMTSRLNGVLWRAATDAGVPFVDIANSLQGGRLCGGNKYVTGVDDLNTRRLQEDYQNLFHPNAAGNLEMARSIYEKIGGVHVDFKGDKVPAESREVYENATITKRFVLDNEYALSGGNMLRVSVRLDEATRGARLKATLYSKPVDLGEHLVDSDGRVDINVQIPKAVRPGPHTLVLRGVGAMGRSVVYYGSIRIPASAVKASREISGGKVAINHSYSSSLANKDSGNSRVMYGFAIISIITMGAIYAVLRKRQI